MRGAVGITGQGNSEEKEEKKAEEATVLGVVISRRLFELCKLDQSLGGGICRITLLSPMMREEEGELLERTGGGKCRPHERTLQRSE